VRPALGDPAEIADRLPPDERRRKPLRASATSSFRDLGRITERGPHIHPVGQGMAGRCRGKCPLGRRRRPGRPARSAPPPVPTQAAAPSRPAPALVRHVRVDEHQRRIGDDGACPPSSTGRGLPVRADERDVAGLMPAPSHAHLPSHPSLPVVRSFWSASNSRAPSSNNSAATESPSSRARSGVPIPDARITSDPSSVATQPP